MSNCVFCEIVAGRIEASIVHEDDITLAFMDIAPLADAHVLVIPKVHIESLDLLPSDIAGRLMQTAVRVAQGLRAAYDPAGISMWQSNGKAAGQDVFHVHLHLLIRSPKDGLIKISPPKAPVPNRMELDRRAAVIRQAIGHRQ